MINLGLSLASSVVMFRLSRQYAKNNNLSFPKVLLKALLWSLITCWSLTLWGGSGGHGIALFPAPSWMNLFLLLTFGGKLYLYFLLISPVLPLVVFLVTFAASQPRIKGDQTDQTHR